MASPGASNVILELSSGIHFINEAWLGAAVIGNSSEPAPISAAGKRAQWSYSTLTEAYKHLLRFQLRDMFRCWRDLLTSRDAVWSWSEPITLPAHDAVYAGNLSGGQLSRE